MSEIFFININTFGATPIMRHIINFLEKDFELSLVESHIKGTYSFNDSCKVNYIKTFKTASDFNNQPVFFKLYKYLYILYYILRKGLLFRNAIIYSNDFQILAIFSWLKSIFKFSKYKIVYHQFELVEEKDLKGLNSRLFRILKRNSSEIELLIVPEINRLNILLNQLGSQKIDSLLFPNTNAGIVNENSDPHALISSIPKESKVIGHIGSIGPNHYIINFLEAYRKFHQPDWYFIMVGKMDPTIQKILDDYNLNNFITIMEIPHKELGRIYSRIDLGLILYKGIDRNFEFCAPNKLFEYWAWGIPVLSHRLEGLKDLFNRRELGELINFNNEDQIVESIHSLLKNAEKDRLKNIFRKEYTIDIFLKELRNSLKTLN